MTSPASSLDAAPSSARRVPHRKASSADGRRPPAALPLAPLGAAMLCGLLGSLSAPTDAFASPALRPPHPLVQPTAHVPPLTFLRRQTPDDQGQHHAQHVRTHAWALATQTAVYRARTQTNATQAQNVVATAAQAAQRYQFAPPGPRALQGQLPWPVGSRAPVAGFGTRMRPDSRTIGRHTGLSWALSTPEDMLSVGAGVVVAIRHVPGLGNVVLVDMQQGIHAIYAQLRTVSVSVWDVVQAGTPIGQGPGPSSWGGEELYFELRVDGIPADPLDWLVPRSRR